MKLYVCRSGTPCVYRFKFSIRVINHALKLLNQLANICVLKIASTMHDHTNWKTHIGNEHLLDRDGVNRSTVFKNEIPPSLLCFILIFAYSLFSSVQLISVALLISGCFLRTKGLPSRR